MTDFRPDDLSLTEEVSELADQMSSYTPFKAWQSLSKLEDEYLPDILAQRELTRRSHNNISADIVVSMRLTYAASMLKETVEINPDKAHGAPVLTGTRFKIARVLAELADGMTVSKMAKEFDLNKSMIVKLLHGLAIQLDRSFFPD